jgi:iron complex outermembrane recepter protein
MKKIFLLFISLILSSQIPFAQDAKKDITKMTKEDVLEMTYDQLLEMPFEDVLKLAEIVGVSLDELYEMLLNKDVVSASKKVESSFEAPLSTSVISYNEIKASGARSVEEALRLVPGLIIREKTNGNFDVHIRGNDNLPPKHMFVYSENSITLVMIDGRPVYNYAHGGTFWETLPVDLEDIDRIEVVRGPSSALYGPNAVSGVVNIITKKPEGKKLSLDGTVQGGMQNTIISSVGIGKAINSKLSFRVTGNFQTLDRNTEELYVHKANNGQGGFITKEELAVLPDYQAKPVKISTYKGDINHLIKPEGDTNYYYRVFDPQDDVNKMYEDPSLARKRYGANAYLFYDLKNDVGFNLKGGYQSSEVLSSTMGDNPSSMVGRESETYYSDFNAKIHGLRAQVNYLGGWQDIVKEDTGFKVDLANINANLEYDLNIGDLNIRPGVAYQLSKYDDTPYLSYIGQGFLNSERKFSSTAISLRADYRVFEKLRFIGALRGEKYNTHDKVYLSYQLIASYNLKNKHNIRLVYSRANRGPFLVDSYANYMWDREGRPDPGNILFKGQENLDLLKMDMFELGYRIKPMKQIQADFECFYTIASDFGALYPDSVNLNGAPAGLGRTWVRMTFDNIDMTSQQYGITASVNYVISENLYLKIFGTYQITKVKNVIPDGQDQTVQAMLTSAYLSFLVDTNFYSSNTSFPNKREDIENKATPSVFGGFYLNYTPIKKLMVNFNGYFYSKQEFYNKYSRYIDNEYQSKTIYPKFILNAKISYEVYKNVLLYVNAKNLIMSDYEFAYMDKIGLLLLVGASFNF